MFSARFQLGVACLLLVGGVRAGAQGPPLPNVPEAYALLALSRMNVSGPVGLVTGSLGVNENNGQLEVDRNVPLLLNTEDGVIAARKASLLTPSRCTSAAFFADITPGNSADQCGTVQSQEIPAGEPPLVPDIESSPICDLPPQFSKFPKCDQSTPVTVAAGTEESLPSGTYGDLTINGGTLRLQGGEYIFCNVTTNNGSQVIAAASSTLLVADSFNVRPNSQINRGGSPQDLRVLVNGKHDAVNIAGGSQLMLVFSGQPAAARPVPLATVTCSFQPALTLLPATNTVVVAQLCALGKPATLNLFSANILGTFVADEINVGDVQGGNTVPTTTTSTSTTSSSTSSTSSSSTSTMSTSSTSTSTTSTSTTSATSASTTSTSTTSSTVASTTSSSTTSTSSTLTSSTASTMPPTTTSTSTSFPTSTSTSSSSTPSTTSTSLPPCDPLRLTSLRLTPRKNDPSRGSLKVRGVLADAGWAGVDPRRSGVDLAVQRVAGLPTCCTVEQQHWMRRGPAEFKFWDMHRTVCPPLSDMRINVSRTGRATFRFFAPRIDLTPGLGSELTLGAVVGNRCSLGSLSVGSLQRKTGGRLVYP